jgi:hypothetical protein
MPQGRSSERRKNSTIKIGQAGCSVVHSSSCAKDIWNPAHHTLSVDRLCSYRDLEIKLMERESQAPWNTSGCVSEDPSQVRTLKGKEPQPL